MNSEAEIWYTSLDATTKSDWKKFEAMFEKNWPRETVVTVTITEKKGKADQGAPASKGHTCIDSHNGKQSRDDR